MSPTTPSHDFETALRARIDGKTKPLGALGRIEALAAQIARAQGRLTPRMEHGRLILFAADLDLAAGHEAALAAVLERLPSLDGIITSPLRRCRMLAQSIAARHGLTLRVDARLIEMDFGAWEGLPWAEIPRAELDSWAADFLHARPHGGESVAQLQARTRAALAEYCAHPGHHLIVTHAGVIKAALATGPRAEDWPAALAFGEFVTI